MSHTRIRSSRPLTALASAALACSASTATLAGDGGEIIREWIGSGSFQDPRNWLDGIVPTASETARIAPVITTLVTLENRSVSIGRLVVDQGAVRLIIIDGALDIAGNPGGDLLVGGPSPALLELGTLPPGQRRLTVRSAMIGTSSGPGEVLGFIAGELLAREEVIVGDASAGMLRDLRRLEAAHVLIGNDGPGAATLMQEIVSGELTIGLGSDGLLTVESLETGSMTLGTQLGVSGHVVITESATVGGLVTVGVSGLGVLEVSNGAKATIGSDLRVGLFASGENPETFERSDGRISVIDRGSHLSVDGDLLLGLLGHASMLVDSNARVTVGGTLTVLDVPGSPERSMEFVLHPPDGLEPILSAGSGIIAPRIDVRFGEATIPRAGDRWVLAEAGGALVRGPLLLEAPGSGLEWTVLEDGHRLIVRLDRSRVPPADVDGDGIVGLGDLLIVLASFGPCPAGEPCPADLDGSGAVDLLDLLQVLGGWSDPAP